MKIISYNEELINLKKDGKLTWTHSVALLLRSEIVVVARATMVPEPLTAVTFMVEVPSRCIQHFSI